jgi:hypothetical protein
MDAMQSDPTTARRLVDLTPEECWELAASRPVGRMAWSGPAGPTVVPMNFSVDGHSVRAHTAAYTAAGREIDDSLVAFQVDSFDEVTRTGWSVLFRGRAHLEYGATSGEPADHEWLTSPRSLGVVVEVSEVTGRQIVAAE